MIEDKFIDKSFKLQNPVSAMRTVSRDIHCSELLQMENGKEYTAVEIQQEFLEFAKRYTATQPRNPITDDILEKWEYVLKGLEQNPRQLNRELDWVMKEYLIMNYLEKHHCGWDDPRISMLDLQYHDIRPHKGLYYLLQRQNRVERLLSEHEITHAITNPPTDTRAYFRGQCLKKYRSKIFGVSWGAISFDIGESAIKRILMPEPAKGSKKYVHELLEKSETVEELLTNMIS
jgi:proteasome accessory factor A